jgi:hypothetical protein
LVIARLEETEEQLEELWQELERDGFRIGVMLEGEAGFERHYDRDEVLGRSGRLAPGGVLGCGKEGGAQGATLAP